MVLGYQCTLCKDIYHSAKGAKICCGRSSQEVDVDFISSSKKTKRVPSHW